LGFAQSGRPFQLAVALFATALMLASCAQVEQQGNPPAVAEVPAAAPRTTGMDTAAIAQHKRMIALFDGEYKNLAAERYLNDILVKLANAGTEPSEPYRVTILNSPIVNAFALPPNNLYVTRGLLALANDAAEVAAVMAHEIAHITARHAVQREEEERRAAVISRAATIVQNREKGEEVEATSRRTLAGFSRQQELDADQIGIKAIARAGFDPYGASRFLNALGRSAALRASLTEQDTSAEKLDILATHPSTPERVAQAVATARQIGAPGIGTTGRAAYLAAIDGMMFGDDPANGSIHGRKFLHGRLGFAFVAPDGFVLENSSQAVLGVAAGGNEFLRLDSVKVAAATPLETYIASGWIDGLIQSSIESIEVNSMPALSANAHAGEWNFRLAVIRFDPAQVYRLIFATRTMTPEAEQRFRTSIESFHHTTAEEVQAMHPPRIALVTAKADDTAETIARRMAVSDRPLDYFLLINGLEQGGRLRPGERYKVVTE
jgi:predicted Zn-dependent protease